MKCCHCKRNVASGAEAQKAIVEYRQADDTNKVFGYMMSDGPLSAATGQILRAWHFKCYWIERKREHKGDVVTGRVLGGGTPTGYDISTVVISREEAESLGIDPDNPSSSTRFLSTQLDELRAISREVGKPVGDPYVTEAFRAHQHGGSYQHEHHLKLDTYQLIAHLRYAHAAEVSQGRLRLFDGHDIAITDEFDSHGFHADLHARVAKQRIVESREADPGHIEPPERDWRDQTVIDI